MARIRTIKPEFFDDIKLSEVSAFARLTFVGLWTQADREGRLEYEPKRLRVRILPFDAVDFHALIEELITAGVVSLYDTDRCKVLQVKGFSKHQRPHPKEPVSELPAFAVAEHVQAVKKNGEPFKGHDEPVRKGREGNGRRKIAPPSTTTEPPADAVLTFPTIGQIKTWHLTQEQIESWADAYPGMDVLAEARRALVWVLANQKKTAGGMGSFLVRWLNKSANGPRTGGAAAAATYEPPPAHIRAMTQKYADLPDPFAHQRNPEVA